MSRSKSRNGMLLVPSFAFGAALAVLAPAAVAQESATQGAQKAAQGAAEGATQETKEAAQATQKAAEETAKGAKETAQGAQKTTEETVSGAKEGAKPAALRRTGGVKMMTATVEAVDHSARTVTLRDEEGQSHSVKVPEDVRAFDQVKKGDMVKVGYQESVAFNVHKKGEAKPEYRSSERMERTQGGQPGRVMEREEVVSAEVVSVDPDKNILKVKGPQGKTRTINVADPEARERLKDIKKGDVIEMTYTEAMAVTLEPAKK
jgi:hypothetical protein